MPCSALRRSLVWLGCQEIHKKTHAFNFEAGTSKNIPVVYGAATCTLVAPPVRAAGGGPAGAAGGLGVAAGG